MENARLGVLCFPRVFPRPSSVLFQGYVLYAFPVVSDELTPERIADRLKVARERKDEALARYEAASAEVAWLEEGLRLFNPDALPEPEAQRKMLDEIFPDGPVFDQGVNPSLRQAMVIAMREHPGRRWTVADLTEALGSMGWLPENGAKRISDMAGEMARLNQVVRQGRGVYKLSPELAAALEAAPGSKE
jgi:hypothetical protein